MSQISIVFISVLGKSNNVLVHSFGTSSRKKGSLRKGSRFAIFGGGFSHSVSQSVHQVVHDDRGWKQMHAYVSATCSRKKKRKFNYG